MKLYANFIVVAFLFSCGFSVEQEGRKVVICPNEFVNVGQHCYYYSPMTTNSWEQAFKLCERFSEKSTLLNIDSIAKWNQVLDYVKEHRLTGVTYWVGGSDDKEEGRWVWTGSNEPFPFTAWCQGEPNNEIAEEDCLVVQQLHGEYCWNDIPCHTGKKHFICET